MKIKKSRQRAIAYICAVMALMPMLLMSVSAYEDIGTVNVRSIKQQYSNWCWAACGECVLSYYGKNTQQNKLVEYVFGSSIYNKAATGQQTRNAIAYYGVDGTWVENSVSYGIISGQIKKDAPLIAGRSYSTYGHMVVISGFDGTSGTNYIEYMDPADGTFHSSSYTSFKGGNGYSYTWSGTIYNF